jgi:peptidoglycan/LPS O-acetylase OafA/YrhL
LLARRRPRNLAEKGISRILRRVFPVIHCCVIITYVPCGTIFLSSSLLNFFSDFSFSFYVSLLVTHMYNNHWSVDGLYHPIQNPSLSHAHNSNTW